MDDFLEKQLNIYKEKLNARDLRSLRNNLTQLEQIIINEKSYKEDEILNQFWYRIVYLGLENKNVELCLIAIAKLRLGQIALIVKSTLQTGREDFGELDALEYVSDFFQIDNNDFTKKLRSSFTSKAEFFSFQRIIELHVSKCYWSEVFEVLDRELNSDDAQLINQRVYYNVAQYNECDENLPEALTYYEKLTSPNEFDLMRVLLKLHLDESYMEIKKYFMVEESSNLVQIWIDYAKICGNIHDVNQVLDNENNLNLYIKYNFSAESGAVEKRLFDKLPEQMLKYLKDGKDFSWWLNKRNIEYLQSITSSLEPDFKAALTEMSHQYEASGLLSKACSLCLCLNQCERFLSIIDSINFKLDIGIAKNHSAKLLLVSKYGSINQILKNFTNYLIKDLWKECDPFMDEAYDDDGLNYKQFQSTKTNMEGTYRTCLRLGLLDEALLVLSTDSYIIKNNKITMDTVDILKSIVTNKYDQDSLDRVDPIVHKTTLDALYKSIDNTSQTLSTNVITIVIYSTSIFLLKLNPPQQEQPQNITGTVPATRANGLDEQQVLFENWLEKLETMFVKLIEFLRGLNFNASNDLVDSTNSLILAVKDKLETLSESVIIRESFKELIKHIAGRCMIESQYKSAAMLYSQVEDNINAVKSLMRMGDVDIVINYSLLVRDITVNRLTMNFLKHLKVDAAVMKDFISKSKL